MVCGMVGGFAKGGKTEGSAKDMMEDKKMAAKMGMTMKESVLTERSPLMMVRYKQPSGVIQETHW